MLNLEWNNRLERWRTELKRQLYRPLGPIEVSGFITLEHLTPQQAVRRKFKPMPVGTVWGAVGVRLVPHADHHPAIRGGPTHHCLSSLLRVGRVCERHEGVHDRPEPTIAPYAPREGRGEIQHSL